MKLLIAYLLGAMFWSIYTARRGRSPRAVLLLGVTMVVSLGYLSRRII